MTIHNIVNSANHLTSEDQVSSIHEMIVLIGVPTTFENMITPDRSQGCARLRILALAKESTICTAAAAQEQPPTPEKHVGLT